MSGTKVTLKDVKDDLNQILDRLSAIEIILNDPMHGISFPEGVNVEVGDQPSDDMNLTAAVDNIDAMVADRLATDLNEGWSDETTIQIQSTSRGHNQ